VFFCVLDFVPVALLYDEYELRVSILDLHVFEYSGGLFFFWFFRNDIILD